MFKLDGFYPSFLIKRKEKNNEKDKNLIIC